MQTPPESGSGDFLGRPAPEDLPTAHPDFDQRFGSAYAAAVAYTMTSPERMYALWGAVRHVVDREVGGAFVECGVWRGGSPMLIGHALLAADRRDRELWLYDTFAGMPEPSEGDVDFTGVPASDRLAQGTDGRENLVVARASRREVEHNVARIGYPAERVHLVEGLVQDTIPAQAPPEIALLRLDTDWESSTRHELEHLWPRLTPGGVLLIDDYGHWSGARRAVDEYFAGRVDAPLLIRIDYTGRIAIRDRPGQSS